MLNITLYVRYLPAHLQVLFIPTQRWVEMPWDIWWRSANSSPTIAVSPVIATIFIVVR